MVQTLKISIARGGCRFATPLYLGAKYVLSFEGERSDEADSVLFVKPRSGDATDTSSMSALAQSEYDSTVSGISLNLNKQVLLDWFKDCEECDVDGYVDAHCYVFDSDGAILADADVTIEYKPVEFAVDETEIATFSDLDKRVTAVEGVASGNATAIEALREKDEELDAADAANLAEAKSFAQAEDATNMAVLRGEIGELKGSVTSVQMVHEKDAPTTGKTYHMIQAVEKDGVWTLGVKQEAEEFSASESGSFAMLDAESQNFTGNNTFNGSGKTVMVTGGAKLDVAAQGSLTVEGAATFTGETNVPTAAASATGTVAASVGWVRSVFSSLWNSAWETAKAAFLAAANTWSGKQTFSGDAALKSSAVDATTVPATTLYGPHLSFQDKNGNSIGLIHGTFQSSADGGRYGLTIEGQTVGGGPKSGISFLSDSSNHEWYTKIGGLVSMMDDTIEADDFNDVRYFSPVCFGGLMNIMPYVRVRSNVTMTTTATAISFSAAGGTPLIPNATYRVLFFGLTKNVSYYSFYAGVTSTAIKTFSLAAPSALAYAQRCIGVDTSGNALTVTANASGVVTLYGCRVINTNVVIGHIEFVLADMNYKEGADD